MTHPIDAVGFLLEVIAVFDQLLVGRVGLEVDLFSFDFLVNFA